MYATWTTNQFVELGRGLRWVDTCFGASDLVRSKCGASENVCAKTHVHYPVNRMVMSERTQR